LTTKILLAAPSGHEFVVTYQDGFGHTLSSTASLAQQTGWGSTSVLESQRSQRLSRRVMQATATLQQRCRWGNESCSHHEHGGFDSRIWKGMFALRLPRVTVQVQGIDPAIAPLARNEFA